MTRKTLLVLVSASPPGCKGEEFLTNEIPFLQKYFDKILFVHHNQSLKDCHTYSDIAVYYFRYLPSQLEKLLYLTLLFRPLILSEIKYLILKYNLFPTFTRINNLLGALSVGKRFAKFLQKLIAPYLEYDSYVYSYWCNFIPVGLSILRKKGIIHRSISRAHGYDVFFERNKASYLPLRDFIYKNLDGIYFISKKGLSYAASKTGNYQSMKLSYLGSIPQYSLSPLDLKNNGSLTIVSCSSVISLKRLGLVAEALALWDVAYKINWIHFGDGPEMEDLKKRVQPLQNSKVRISLKGYHSNEFVLNFYKNNEIDLFVNVSESEGIPYAMMEALSFGIPLMGTAVGGVREIISDQENGILLSEKPTALDIYKQLLKFLTLDIEQRLTFRENAFKVWDNKFNAAKNFDAFAKEISIP